MLQSPESGNLKQFEHGFETYEIFWAGLASVKRFLRGCNSNTSENANNTNTTNTQLLRLVLAHVVSLILIQW